MRTYTTIQGDTWDLMAYNLYGSESHMKELIEANRRYIDIMVFPGNVTIDVPEISESNDEQAPAWRTEDE